MKKLVFFIFLFTIFFLYPYAIWGFEKSPRIFIGQDVDSIDSYIKDVGHVPDGFMTYTSIQDLEGLDSSSDKGSGVQCAQALIDKYPNAQIQIGFYVVGALSNIAKGHHDDNLFRLASWFKENSETRFYLRIGYEFDNPENNYEPVLYIKAYKHIVDRLRDLGVKNVFYVWHSYAAFVEGNVDRWYPGDDYVDWVGISFFNAFSQSNMSRVISIARKHNKLVMIAEATPQGVGVEQGERAWKFWYKRLFDFANKNNIEIICYINWDWETIPMFQGQGWGNGCIEDNKVILNRWKVQVFKK